MKCYSYVLPRDFGFAPNPFSGYCTLATCKPGIRKIAQKGDWIIGTGVKKSEFYQHIIYAMQVTEKLKFDDYWNDKRFQCKKPVFNRSLKFAYGDNIYHSEGDEWLQSNSHHSNPDGSINFNNLNRDISGKYVLISDSFYYFGKKAIKLPDDLKSICKERQGYKCNFEKELLDRLISWLKSHNKGINGLPISFNSFKRYKGPK